MVLSRVADFPVRSPSLKRSVRGSRRLTRVRRAVIQNSNVACSLVHAVHDQSHVHAYCISQRGATLICRQRTNNPIHSMQRFAGVCHGACGITLQFSIRMLRGFSSASRTCRGSPGKLLRPSCMCHPVSSGQARVAIASQGKGLRTGQGTKLGSTRRSCSDWPETGLGSSDVSAAVPGVSMANEPLCRLWLRSGSEFYIWGERLSRRSRTRADRSCSELAGDTAPQSMRF